VRTHAREEGGKEAREAGGFVQQGVFSRVERFP
jgi:hypothetical protein